MKFVDKYYSLNLLKSRNTEYDKNYILLINNRLRGVFEKFNRTLSQVFQAMIFNTYKAKEKPFVNFKYLSCEE